MKIKVKDLILIIVLVIVIIGVAIYFAISNSNKNGKNNNSNDGENSTNQGYDDENRTIVTANGEYILGKLKYKVTSDFNVEEDEEGIRTYSKYDIDNDCLYTFIVQALEYEEGTEEETLKQIEEMNFGVDKETVLSDSVLYEEKVNGYAWNIKKMKMYQKDEDMTIYGEFYYGFRNGKIYMLIFNSAKKGENQTVSVDALKPIKDSLDFNR